MTQPQTKRVHKLLRALEPFATLELPEEEAGDAVWLYVGHRDPIPDPRWTKPHLKVSDIRKAKKVWEANQQ